MQNKQNTPEKHSKTKMGIRQRDHWEPTEKDPQGQSWNNSNNKTQYPEKQEITTPSVSYLSALHS